MDLSFSNISLLGTESVGILLSQSEAKFKGFGSWYWTVWLAATCETLTDPRIGLALSFLIIGVGTYLNTCLIFKEKDLN